MDSKVLFDTQTDLQINPSEFAQMLHTTNCVAYVGAGLSQKHTCSWVDLVNLLCEKCGVVIDKPLDSSNVPELLEYADKAYDHDRECFIKCLREAFPTEGDRNDPAVYTLLWKLPLTAIVTTNFDHGLWFSCQNVTKHKNCQAYPLLKSTTVSKGGVFYLHGKPADDIDPLNIVLGTKAFNRAYAQESPLVAFLKSVVRENGLFVLGARLEEPPVKELFLKIQMLGKAWNEDFGIPIPRKFAIIPRPFNSSTTTLSQPDDAEREFRRHMEKFNAQVNHMRTLGFEVFSYDILSNGKHDNLYMFIEQMTKTHFAPEETTTNFS